MKLISMTDFVLEQHEQCVSSTQTTYNYAKFLKQPLELWMFVPCDYEGNVLENLSTQDYRIKNNLSFYVDNWLPKCKQYCEEYQQAKERCLFVWQDGYDYNTICDMFLSIEDVINFQFELTQTAIKQLGL